MSSKYTTIFVTRKVFEELAQLKKLLGARTWDELMRRLLDMYKECKKVKVKELVCNEMREAEAALVAWYRKLGEKLGDGEAVMEAMAYLREKPGEPGIFIVDEEKCK
jgi:predicted CopG family antitoxin